MKNILKMLPILLLTILVSCKKKDPKPEAFDITKHAVIGKLRSGYPYIITLESIDKAVLTHYGASNGSYTYLNGVFKFNFQNEVVGSFVIENGQIKSYDGPVVLNTYDLVKIPSTNQFEGKTFKGGWNGIVHPTEIKFTTTQFTEITNNQQSVIDYTLINNLAIKKEVGANFTLFIMMNDLLEGGRDKSGITSWGTFTMQ